MYGQSVQIRRQDGNPIWVGNWALPPVQQGLQVLGAPIGTDQYVQAALTDALHCHARLLEHIPGVADLQCAWLLLLYSANARSTYLLRLVPPDLAEPFAEAHGTAILTCMANLITGDVTPLPPPAAAQARLPTRLGGLGLRSAAEQRHAAYSASWSDALPAIQLRTGTSRSRALAGITAAAKHTSAKGAHPRNRAPTSHRL